MARVARALHFRGLLTCLACWSCACVVADLVGQEDLGHPLLYFLDDFRALFNQTENGASDLPFYLHVGESNWEVETFVPVVASQQEFVGCSVVLPHVASLTLVGCVALPVPHAVQLNGAPRPREAR